jgi:hypothetical protein
VRGAKHSTGSTPTSSRLNRAAGTGSVPLADTAEAPDMGGSALPIGHRQIGHMR